MFKKKPTIGWISSSSKKTGGNAYNQQAGNILLKDFDLELISAEAERFKGIRYLKIPELFFNLLRLEGEKDLWIRDFFSTISLLFDKTKGKNLAMIHQVDFLAHPFAIRIFFSLLERIFYRGLKRADAIVVVSNFWRDHFLKKGYQNVYTIYNSFNLDDFEIADQEIVEFKKKYNLEGKPILYLGNCKRAKGVVESYGALKNIDAYLVTSGKPLVKIPAMNLFLGYRDYLCLLKASSIVITMSKFKEGWCRTAHEAMLCRVPVIGSGMGGMKELLKGGKQIICSDFNLLKEKVENLLEDEALREKIGNNGYNFAKDFTIERFEKNWLELLGKLL